VNDITAAVLASLSMASVGAVFVQNPLQTLVNVAVALPRNAAPQTVPDREGEGLGVGVGSGDGVGPGAGLGDGVSPPPPPPQADSASIAEINKMRGTASTKPGEADCMDFHPD